MKRIALVIAFLGFVLISTPARATVPGVWMRPLQDPASQISLSSVEVFKQGYRLFECLSFKNNGPKVISHVRFQFSYLDGNRKEVGNDLLERNGDFPAGSGETAPVITELVATTDLGKFRTCQVFKAPNRNVAMITAQVNRVDYADGTSWSRLDQGVSPSPTSAP